jgi:hypothetical protein
VHRPPQKGERGRRASVPPDVARTFADGRSFLSERASERSKSPPIPRRAQKTTATRLSLYRRSIYLCVAPAKMIRNHVTSRAGATTEPRNARGHLGAPLYRENSNSSGETQILSPLVFSHALMLTMLTRTQQLGRGAL